MDKLFWKICLHLLVLKQLRWLVFTPPYADVSEATSNIKSERRGKESEAAGRTGACGLKKRV